MFAEEAANGNYDPLTNLKGVSFIVRNGSYSGTFGDHLIVSDGKERHYSEAVHESSYPAVRVEPGGTVQSAEVDDARKYWAAYSKDSRCDPQLAHLPPTQATCPSIRPHRKRRGV
jgi:hypothetical protein